MKILLLVHSLILTTALIAQKGKQYNCEWLKEDITELSIPLDKYDYNSKAGIYYLIFNNDLNISLYLAVENSAVQDRILKQGMNIWINMAGKKVKETGIRFPLGSQYAGVRYRLPALTNNINEEVALNTPISMANIIEIIGFKGEDKRLLPLDSPDNFNGSISYSTDGVLHCKIVMPIDKLQVRNSKNGDGAMPFNIGLEYGAPPRQGSIVTFQENINTAKPLIFWIKNIKLAPRS